MTAAVSVIASEAARFRRGAPGTASELRRAHLVPQPKSGAYPARRARWTPTVGGAQAAW